MEGWRNTSSRRFPFSFRKPSSNFALHGGFLHCPRLEPFFHMDTVKVHFSETEEILPCYISGVLSHKHGLLDSQPVLRPHAFRKSVWSAVFLLKTRFSWWHDNFWSWIHLQTGLHRYHFSTVFNVSKFFLNWSCFWNILYSMYKQIWYNVALAVKKDWASPLVLKDTLNLCFTKAHGREAIQLAKTPTTASYGVFVEITVRSLAPVHRKAFWECPAAFLKQGTPRHRFHNGKYGPWPSCWEYAESLKSVFRDILPDKATPYRNTVSVCYI